MPAFSRKQSYTSESSEVSALTDSGSDYSSDNSESRGPLLTSNYHSIFANFLRSMNSCAFISNLFANSGKDLVSEIPYSPSWWCQGPAVYDEQTEQEFKSKWRTMFLLELQKIQFFLSGKSSKPTYSTDFLESLIRTKEQVRGDMSLTPNNIMECLLEIPAFHNALANTAFSEGLEVPITVFPVNDSCEGSTVSECVEETFWWDNLQEDEQVDWDEIPYFAKLSSLFLVTVSGRGRILDEVIKPDLYKAEGLEKFKQFWEVRNKQIAKTSELNTKIDNLSFVDGNELISSLETVYADLETTEPKAADEILNKINDIKQEIEAVQLEIDQSMEEPNAEQQAFNEYRNSLPYYCLQSLVITTFTGEELLATKNEDNQWEVIEYGQKYVQKFSTIQKLVRDAPKSLLFYVKESELNAKPVDFAPSIIKFLEADNENDRQNKSPKESLVDDEKN